MNSTTEWSVNYTSEYLNYSTITISVKVVPGSFSTIPHVIPTPAMVGSLSVQTVSFILLGVGAAAPIILITTVAVVLRLRRLHRHGRYSKYVLDYEARGKEAWHDSQKRHGKDATVLEIRTVRESSTENGRRQIPTFPMVVQNAADLTDFKQELTESKIENIGKNGDSAAFSRVQRNSHTDYQQFQSPRPFVEESLHNLERDTDEGLKQPVASISSFSSTPRSHGTVLSVTALVERSPRQDLHEFCDTDTRPSTSDLGPTVEIKPETVDMETPRHTEISISGDGKTSALLESVYRRKSSTSSSQQSETGEVDFPAVEEDDCVDGGMANPIHTAIVYSSDEQTVEAALSAEEENVLRCLDEVLLQYMDFGDEILQIEDTIPKKEEEVENPSDENTK